MQTETNTWEAPVIEELSIPVGTENVGADGFDGESLS